MKKCMIIALVAMVGFSSYGQNYKPNFWIYGQSVNTDHWGGGIVANFPAYKKFGIGAGVEGFQLNKGYTPPIQPFADLRYTQPLSQGGNVTFAFQPGLNLLNNDLGQVKLTGTHSIGAVLGASFAKWSLRPYFAIAYKNVGYKTTVKSSEGYLNFHFGLNF